ncbi:MAG: hypothetical protein ACOH1I_09005 [Gallionellaceae bacterium]|jgi:antitoxin StbD
MKADDVFNKKIVSSSKNKLSLYCAPAKVQEILMNKFEDMELNAIADARLNDGRPLIEIDLGSL